MNQVKSRRRRHRRRCLRRRRYRYRRHRILRKFREEVAFTGISVHFTRTFLDF